jgi:hypothetical protein
VANKLAIALETGVPATFLHVHEEVSMKRMSSIIAKSLFAVLLSSGPFALTAHAQHGPAVTAYIPFAFSADGYKIAAGTYRLQLINNGYLMYVRNVSTGKGQFIAVRPVESGTPDSHASLVFQVCEGHSHLTEVHIPGADRFGEVADGRRQKDAETGACSKEYSSTIAAR